MQALRPPFNGTCPPVIINALKSSFSSWCIECIRFMFYLVLHTVDTTDPVVFCPSDISARIPLGTGGTTVTWGTVTATDASNDVTITSDFSSGASFSVGSTTVTYRAVDPSGNEGICTFVVTITTCEFMNTYHDCREFEMKQHIPVLR